MSVIPLAIKPYAHITVGKETADLLPAASLFYPPELARFGIIVEQFAQTFGGEHALTLPLFPRL